MPTENREGFVGDETDNSTVSNTESQASGASEPNAEASQPTRRRRGGRRVVRGTGAAGASLELQVQEHAAPLFEAPALPDADASASTGTADNNASVAAALPIMPIMRTVRLGVVLWLMTMMSRVRCAVVARCPMISRKTMSVRFAVVAL